MPCQCPSCVEYRADSVAVQQPTQPPDMIECAWCGEEVEDSESFWVADDDRACRDCYDDGLDCGLCDERHPRARIAQLYLTDWGQHVNVCDYCYDSSVYWCHRCDAATSDEYTVDEYGCESCRSDGSGLIESWNYRPTPRFIGSDDFHMGMELETDELSDIGDVAEAMHGFDNLYCKEDGSLSYGVEIVSHPGTLKAWQGGDVIDWTHWRGATYCFEGQRHVSSAGIHVHVSRTAFERNGKWSSSHLWKFLQLHYRNRYAFQKLSGRDKSTYARWNTIADRPMTKDDSKRHASGDRYRVINVTNDATVECRYFQADERKNIMLKNLELVHAAVGYTRTLSAKDVSLGLLDFKHFRGWYTRRARTYPNLVNYTTEQGYKKLIDGTRKGQKEYDERVRVKKEEERIQREREAHLRDMANVGRDARVGRYTQYTPEEITPEVAVEMLTSDDWEQWRLQFVDYSSDAVGIAAQMARAFWNACPYYNLDSRSQWLVQAWPWVQLIIDNTGLADDPGDLELLMDWFNGRAMRYYN